MSKYVTYVKYVNLKYHLVMGLKRSECESCSCGGNGGSDGDVGGSIFLSSGIGGGLLCFGFFGFFVFGNGFSDGGELPEIRAAAISVALEAAPVFDGGSVCILVGDNACFCVGRLSPAIRLLAFVD